MRPTALLNTQLRPRFEIETNNFCCDSLPSKQRGGGANPLTDAILILNNLFYPLDNIMPLYQIKWYNLSTANTVKHLY